MPTPAERHLKSRIGLSAKEQNGETKDRLYVSLCLVRLLNAEPLPRAPVSPELRLFLSPPLSCEQSPIYYPRSVAGEFSSNSSTTYLFYCQLLFDEAEQLLSGSHRNSHLFQIVPSAHHLTRIGLRLDGFHLRFTRESMSTCSASNFDSKSVKPSCSNPSLRLGSDVGSLSSTTVSGLLHRKKSICEKGSVDGSTLLLIQLEKAR